MPGELSDNPALDMVIAIDYIKLSTSIKVCEIYAKKIATHYPWFTTYDNSQVDGLMAKEHFKQFLHDTVISTCPEDFFAKPRVIGFTFTHDNEDMSKYLPCLGEGHKCMLYKLKPERANSLPAVTPHQQAEALHQHTGARRCIFPLGEALDEQAYEAHLQQFGKYRDLYQDESDQDSTDQDTDNSQSDEEDEEDEEDENIPPYN